MAEQLDNLLLVGFEVPDDSTIEGRDAYRKVMDVANVPKEGIHFIEGKPSVVDIIKNNFIQDKSQNSGYRIGNTLCIVSDAIDLEYRHSVERLKKVDISVRTGFNHIDFTNISEIELIKWYETGKYTRIENSHDESKNDSDLDSLLDSVLDVQEETHVDEKPSQENSTVDNSNNLVEDSELNIDDIIDFDLDYDIDDDKISETESAVKEKNNTNDSQINSIEETNDTLLSSINSEIQASTSSRNKYEKVKEPVIENNDQIKQPRPVIKEELSSIEKKKEPTDLTDPDLDFDSLMNSIDSIPERDEEVRKPIVNNTIPVSNNNIIDDYEPVLGNTFDNDNLSSSNDDDQYINEMKAKRASAEKRRAREEQERQQKLLEEQEEKGNNYQFNEEEEELVDGANEFYREAESLTEETHHADGTRRDYYDYLSEDDAKYQKTVESTNEKFGSDIGEHYLGQGKGRIILVTSGKGGVGKSLVSNGLAMALSSARAKELDERHGASTARTWLIESDYNSPQLAVAYETGRNKNIGNIADALSRSEGNIDNKRIKQLIEDNAFFDEETGINILACPPLSSRRSFKEIPMAILLAIKYASDQGDDVIIDHGNLTTGEYSEFDMVLSMKLAHRIIIVCDMRCIQETQSVTSLLCERDPSSVIPKRSPASVSIVLNSAKKEQYYLAQDMLAPFEIINIIPPIDAFRAENSLSGDAYLPNAPKEIQKAVMDRCGRMLVKLGYRSLERYFPNKVNFSYKKEGNKSFIRRLLGFLSGDK